MSGKFQTYDLIGYETNSVMGKDEFEEIQESFGAIVHVSSQATRFYLKMRHETVLHFASAFLKNPPPPSLRPTASFVMDNFFVVFGGRDQWQTSTAKEFWNCCDTATMEAKWLPKKLAGLIIKFRGSGPFQLRPTSLNRKYYNWTATREELQKLNEPFAKRNLDVIQKQEMARAEEFFNENIQEWNRNLISGTWSYVRVDIPWMEYEEEYSPFSNWNITNSSQAFRKKSFTRHLGSLLTDFFEEFNVQEDWNKFFVRYKSDGNDDLENSTFPFGEHRDVYPFDFQISGAFPAKCNGVYVRGEELRGGRHWYHNYNYPEQVLIWYDPGKKWLLTTSNAKDGAAWAILEDQTPQPFKTASCWKRYSDDKGWYSCPEIKLTKMRLEQRVSGKKSDEIKI